MTTRISPRTLFEMAYDFFINSQTAHPAIHIFANR